MVFSTEWKRGWKQRVEAVMGLRDIGEKTSLFQDNFEQFVDLQMQI